MTDQEKQDMLTLHWMALRYVDMRMTYAVSQFNEITERMILAGIVPKGQIWATDGRFGDPQDLIAKYGHDGRKAQ